MLVIKLGGSAGIDSSMTLDDLATLWPGERIVFVHGANAALDAFQRQVGHEPRLVTSSTGQVSRFTDPETMDDFLAIYAGRTNKRLVEGLQMRGINAVGLTALDGGIARGPRKDAIRIVEDGKPKILRGDYAGSIKQIDTRLIDLLLDNGYLPVLTPPAVSLNGEAINVDGDKLSLRLAEALQAMWAETLGVQVNIEAQEWPVFIAGINPSTPLEEMPEMWRLGWGADYPLSLIHISEPTRPY